LDPKNYLYYYRDTDQKEIDLLFVERDTIYPIEVKKNETPKNPTKNFKVLQKYKMNIGMGLIVDTCEKIRPLNEDAYSYPVFLLGQ
jgi:predicted AAA+ superfamily ATPase